MPFAVAVLLHPFGTFVALTATIVAGLFAVQSKRFLPAFTAAAAAQLTLLAFLQQPPSATGLVCLGLALVLLHAEFLRPAYGAWGLLGWAGAAYASWSLLAPLAPLGRAAAALAAASLLLGVVGYTTRLRTLPP